MTDQAPASNDPANFGSLLGAFRLAIDATLLALDDMLPAQVIAYNRTKNLAQVQILVPIVDTLGNVTARAQVASIPVMQMGGGGFMLNFPVRAGDLGFIKSNDRDISIFKQTGVQSPPNTKRLHSFEDAAFIPVAFFNFVIAASDTTNVTLQSLDGTTRFSMGSGNTCVTDEISYTQSADAILDVQSISRAFKIPRMTVAQQASIASPIGGMMVYLIDFSPTPKFSFYTDGVGWS